MKKWGIFVLTIVIVVSCRTQKSTPGSVETSDRKFYTEYSEKLGIPLKGNESRKMIRFIADWLGVPYKYNGCGKEGTDCSCFTKYLMLEVYGVELPRKSHDMYLKSTKIEKVDLKEGDLVFFSETPGKVTHVGVFIGDTKFVHASTSKGVIISDLTESWFIKKYFSAGRIR